MFTRSCLGIALALTLILGGVTLAKPPDLPEDLKVTFATGDAENVDAGNQAERNQGGGIRQGSSCLDSGCLSLCETVARAARFLGALEIDIELREASVQDRTVDPDRLAQVRHLFTIAEHCRARSDLDMALNCYRETHRLCPDSSYGRQALVRLNELQRGRQPFDGAEEAEPPETAAPAKAEKSVRIHQAEEARRAYARGQRAFRDGNIDRAHRHFQRAHLLSPDSGIGGKAMRRVNEIENASRRREGRERDASGEETQEPSTPRSPEKPRRKTREQRLLEQTIPLGPAEESEDPDTQARIESNRNINVDATRPSPGSTGHFLLGAGINSDAGLVGSIRLQEKSVLTPHLPAIDPQLVRGLEDALDSDSPEPDWYIVLEENRPSACFSIWVPNYPKRERDWWRDLGIRRAFSAPTSREIQITAVIRLLYGADSFQELLHPPAREEFRCAG